MANDDDAIYEFAPEESGEPRPEPSPAAEPPHVPSADVYVSASSPEVEFPSRSPEVEFPSLEVDDFDALVDVYAGDAPEIDGAVGEVDPAVLADMYASPSPEVDATVYADTYGASPSAEREPDASLDDYAAANQSPPPFESSGGVQVVAALATIGMLAIMYAVFVNQRSDTPLAMPSRVTAPAPTPAPASEPDLLASSEPPLVSDAAIPPANVRPRPYFDDPFGLTRGLSPSIPLQGFDPAPARAPADPDSAASPAVEPERSPVAGSAPAASGPATAAPEPPPPAPRASSALTPLAAPTPAAPTPPPSATAQPSPPPSVTPSPNVTPSPAATASIPRNAPAPAVSAASTPAAPPPSIAGLAPAPAPAPASSAAPGVVTPPAAGAPVETNQTGIQNTLARYRKAFSALNASAAREVWPTVNERSLSRAFDRLEQQDVSFERCQIEVTNNDRAEATCNGTARYVPRVGSRTPRVDQREWRFNLVKVKDEWLIGAVDAR